MAAFLPPDGQSFEMDSAAVSFSPHSSQSAAGCNEFEFFATSEEVQAQEHMPEAVSETAKEKQFAYPAVPMYGCWLPIHIRIIHTVASDGTD